MRDCIDWDHLDATDSTGELGSLINLARLRGLHVSAAATKYSKSRSSSPADACVMVPRRRCIDGCESSR
jgi:hypothetical protein